MRGCRHSQFALSRTAPTPRTLGLSRGNVTPRPLLSSCRTQISNPSSGRHFSCPRKRSIWWHGRGSHCFSNKYGRTGNFNCSLAYNKVALQSNFSHMSGSLRSLLERWWEVPWLYLQVPKKVNPTEAHPFAFSRAAADCGHYLSLWGSFLSGWLLCFLSLLASFPATPVETPCEMAYGGTFS